MTSDAVVPDDKDWTWVLTRPCPDCGYDARAVAPADLGRLLRAEGAAWPALLDRPDVAARPRPGVWSPLEYGCHVRDVFRLAVVRLALLQAEDDPTFANWDQDETAVTEAYARQDPAVMAGDLRTAADALADAFDATGDWDRPGRRSDGAVFTVGSLGRYFLHDTVHHRWDVTR